MLSLKMDEENLKRKLKNLHQNEMDLAFIFIILLYALIEEDIKSPNDIYSLIYNTIGIINLLHTLLD